MHSPSGMRQEYARRMLDFFLNSPFSPANDYYVVIDGRSYMGRLEGSAAKMVAFDFDGVIEKKGAPPLYISVREKIGEKNRAVGMRDKEVLSCLGRLKMPADVPGVERKIGRIYTECGLTYRQYMDANIDAAEEFIDHDIVKGAKPCIRRLDSEMGYVPFFVSGCDEPALGIVCDHLEVLGNRLHGIMDAFHNEDEAAVRDYLEILRSRVRGTTVDFYGGEVRPKMMLGYRKPEAKGDVMERTVGTRHGCCFVIDDNPSPLEDPFIKAGINPSIITGDFKRSELPFDVTVPCPEAREDLTRLIPPIYRYEYGWVATRKTDVVTEDKIIKAASGLARSLSDERSIRSDQDRFVLASRAYKLIELKKARGLARKTDDAEDMTVRFAASKVEDRKRLADELLEYLYSYVPEMRAEPCMLEDLL